MDKRTRTLIYDIETSYTVGAVWGLYDQNVATVLREPYMISFAWKWLGEKKTHVLALPDFKLYKTAPHSDYELVKKLHELFDEADVIIAHNGNSFDQKWSYGRFLINGMEPPSPSQYVDTKVISKSKFKLNSNSLNNLANYLGLGEKVTTGGIDLWVDCIEKNSQKAWNLMKKYNKQDVVLLEKVYEKLKPYVTNHPNMALMAGEIVGCPNCGSNNISKRGFTYTRTNKKQRFQCTDCGAWSSSSLKEGNQVR